MIKNQCENLEKVIVERFEEKEIILKKKQRKAATIGKSIEIPDWLRNDITNYEPSL